MKQVTTHTDFGDMTLDFQPDKAPGHVDNFVELAESGFYDGGGFHRIMDGFMIQGGCPKGDGTGKGPRQLKAEFNDTPHVAGTLSMARSADPDSASSQFFIMTTKNAALDDPKNPYSIFGRLVSGDATLEAIANAPGQLNPRDQTIRPAEPQRIEEAIVLKALNGS